MSIHRSALALLTLVAVAAAACTGAGGGAGPSPSPTTPVSTPGDLPLSTPTPDPDRTTGPLDLPATIVDPVVADAAGRAGVTPERVTVLSAEAVTFPDGSLGCPQPGMMYTQALVDGYRIVVEANGITFDYRGSGSDFRICTQGL